MSQEQVAIAKDENTSKTTELNSNYRENGSKTMNQIKGKNSKHEIEEEDSDLSEDESTSSPSVLKIMAKNHSSISQTVALIHKEAGKFNVEVEPNVERTIKSLTSDQVDCEHYDNDDDDHDESGLIQEQNDNIRCVANDDRVMEELTSAIGKANIESYEKTVNNLTGNPNSKSNGSSGSGIKSNMIHDKKLLVQHKEIEGLSNFLGDANVQQLIKSVAGNETTSFIDKTLEAVKTSKSIQEKRAIVTGSIKQLHSDLLTNKDKIARDPLFSLALGVAGINKRSINFD